MSKDIKDGSFSIMIQKKNPKKNPLTHKIETVQDIFDAVNEKNLNRFIKDFKQGLQVAMATRSLIESIAKEQGLSLNHVKETDVLKMPSFTWIED